MIGWVFTMVIYGTAAPQGPYPDQQACEVARIEVVEKWPGMRATLCTPVKAKARKRRG